MNNSTDFIAQAKTIVARLEKLDQRRVAFGAGRYDYRFPAPLAIEQVEAFERRYATALPVPYRRFITELGNGGPGPYYGVTPLNSNSPQLLEPFPYAQATEFDDETPDELWDATIPGAIQVGEYGCATYFLLVLKGPNAGEVWWDARWETGISPYAGDVNYATTFDEWWLGTMRRHLELFERIYAMMEAGVEHETIHQQLESGVLQLMIDETMLSIMNVNPAGKPEVFAPKPWGRACGLVEEHYQRWLSETGRGR